MFFANHNYRYLNDWQIHSSQIALHRLKGPEIDPGTLKTFLRLSPESFSIVRDPLKRFVSGFSNKILIGDDPVFVPYRDMITSIHGIDLSPEANPAESCLAFAKLIASHDDQSLIEAHFRPQHLNLAVGSRFTVDTILRLEDREALLAFFSKWIGAEKAKWFLTLQFNVQKYKYAPHEMITDELKELVRKIYAQDYALFYQ